MTYIPPFNCIDYTDTKRFDYDGLIGQNSSDIHTVYVKQDFTHYGSKRLRSNIFNRINPKLHCFNHVYENDGSIVKGGTLFLGSSKANYFEYKTLSQEDKFEYEKLRLNRYQDDEFIIVSKMNGMALIFSDNYKMQVEKLDKTNKKQKWIFENGKLKSVYNYYLTFDNGYLKLDSWKNDSSQNVKMKDHLIIINDKVLDINYGVDKEGTEVILYESWNGINQQWDYVYEIYQ